ncbi:hypothetical protein SPRA44_750099 [Serratia proteamaculans]|nr:hypothetical protein SPRA44_750099 [Serratia proteamaculans]
MIDLLLPAGARSQQFVALWSKLTHQFRQEFDCVIRQHLSLSSGETLRKR